MFKKPRAEELGLVTKLSLDLSLFEPVFINQINIHITYRKALYIIYVFPHLSSISLLDTNHIIFKVLFIYFIVNLH